MTGIAEFVNSAGVDFAAMAFANFTYCIGIKNSYCAAKVTPMSLRKSSSSMPRRFKVRELVPFPPRYGGGVGVIPQNS